MANHALSAPATSAKAADWNAAVSAYREAASRRDVASPNDWEDAAQESAWENLVDQASKALTAVTKHPATTLPQLAEKCALVKAEYPDAMCLDGDDCEAIIADVLRIASADAISTAGENPALVDAIEQYLAAARVMRDDPAARMSMEEDARLFAVMNDVDGVFVTTQARTITGAVTKLRRIFPAMVQEPWSDFAVFDDRPPAFADGIRSADIYARMFWGAIEDLQRIAIDQDAARLANGGAAWDSAFAVMEAAKATADAFGEDNSDAANDADEQLSLAISVLLKTQAPDNAALLWKAEYLFGETTADGYSPSWRADLFDPYMADVRRLAAMEG